MSNPVSPVARIRRHALRLLALIAIVAALLPTAAFASGMDGRSGPDRYNNQWSNQSNNHWNAPQQNQWNRQHQQNDWEGHHSTWDGSRDNRGGNPNWGHDGGQWNNRCETTYRVHRGDTLSEIAGHFHVNMRALMQANNLHNPNHIIAGQMLCIP